VKVDISLPGEVVTWLHNQKIIQHVTGHSPAEKEWRTALACATSRKVGRGIAFDLEVSAASARTLADDPPHRDGPAADAASGGVEDRQRDAAGRLVTRGLARTT
jgi:hypothetical protein